MGHSRLIARTINMIYDVLEVVYMTINILIVVILAPSNNGDKDTNGEVF